MSTSLPGALPPVPVKSTTGKLELLKQYVVFSSSTDQALGHHYTMDSSNPGRETPPQAPALPPSQLPSDAGKQTQWRRPIRRPMERSGYGTRGAPIHLITNHFKVGVSSSQLDDHFYQYNVKLSYEDGTLVENESSGVARRLINSLYKTYKSELSDKSLAFDGESTLFTVGSLPGNNLSFTVVLEDVAASSRHGDEEDEEEADRKRWKRVARTKMFDAQIVYSAKIPIRALGGSDLSSDLHCESALRVLDIILRQNAAERNCLLVRQAFFSNNPRNFFDVGGGVQGVQGFSSSFHITQSGLSLNFDVSTTVVLKAQSVLDFLNDCDNAKTRNEIDWVKAKRVLKSLRVKVRTSRSVFKICGLSEQPCNEQLFSMTVKTEDEDRTVDITVYDYFVKHHKIAINKSAFYPCLNVGKPERPLYYPVELCDLVPLQRYKKALSSNQRSVLVDKTRQKPQDRKKVLENAIGNSKYDKDPMLLASGISIDPRLMELEGRILSAPKLIVGGGADLYPRNGRWNFMQKTLWRPESIENWAAVSFFPSNNPRRVCEDLVRSGNQKGLNIAPPVHILIEDQQMKHASPTVRVDKMFEKIRDAFPDDTPKFLLCFLPERKNSNLYGPWKRKNLVDHGIITQCLSPLKVNDQYITNILLKINAKLGGVNSLLDSELKKVIPHVSKLPTLLLGMDVSHNSPGQADLPSIAAVVGSLEWPLVSRYKACVRAQSPKAEMIDSLFMKTSEEKDEGIIRELLVDFYASSKGLKPQNIIIFRDGVSESQFNQVLNIELTQIIEACRFLDQDWFPKFMVIVALKNHHTRFFLPHSADNIQPGTVIDRNICHPQNNDFYMCAHKGIIGTSRPVHYHVLLDEIGYSTDDLQELVHSLSYVYQRSSVAASIVAPISYAHLAAAQVGQFLKSDHFSESSLDNGALPPPTHFHQRVRTSMFFC